MEEECISERLVAPSLEHELGQGYRSCLAGSRCIAGIVGIGVDHFRRFEGRKTEVSQEKAEHIVASLCCLAVSTHNHSVGSHQGTNDGHYEAEQLTTPSLLFIQLQSLL